MGNCKREVCLPEDVDAAIVRAQRLVADLMQEKLEEPRVDIYLFKSGDRRIVLETTDFAAAKELVEGILRGYDAFLDTYRLPESPSYTSEIIGSRRGKIDGFSFFHGRRTVKVLSS